MWYWGGSPFSFFIDLFALSSKCYFLRGGRDFLVGFRLSLFAPPTRVVGTCLLWFRSQFVRHARVEVVAWRSHEKRHCGAQPRRHLGGIFASCAWACTCSDVLYSFHHIHILVAFFSVDVRIQTLFEKKGEKKKTTAAAPAAATSHVLPKHAQRRRLSIICRQQQQKTKP